MKLCDGWETMISHLLGMLAASDSATTPNAETLILETFQRIGRHLDELPEEHRLPFMPFKDFMAAREEILCAS